MHHSVVNHPSICFSVSIEGPHITLVFVLLLFLYPSAALRAFPWKSLTFRRQVRGLCPEQILQLVDNHIALSGYLVNLHVLPPPALISAADCLWVPHTSHSKVPWSVSHLESLISIEQC